VTEKRTRRFSLQPVVAIPALAAANVYVQMSAPIQPPLFSRTIHPASPPDITAYDKKIDLNAGEDPFWPLEKSNPEEFRKHVENGRQVYYRNCVFCHGDNLAGTGMFIHGLDPIPPISPKRSRCCATRFSSGGFPREAPGCPKKGDRGTRPCPPGRSS
jgi:hypothetical protein